MKTTESIRTEKAIEMNRSSHAWTLRERVETMLAGHRRAFTMRGLRRALRYREAAIWNVRRVVRMMMDAGLVNVVDVRKNAYVLKIA